MTNEQAKSELMQIYMSLSEEKKKALDVAFKAMEQADTIPVMYYPQVDGITPTVVAQADGEYISRQAVLDLLEDTNNGWIINEVLQLPSVKPQPCEDANANQHNSNAFNNVGQHINALEVKTGHWALHNEGYYDESYVCSKCDGDSPFDYKYCPYCGARMESEDKK